MENPASDALLQRIAVCIYLGLSGEDQHHPARATIRTTLKAADGVLHDFPDAQCAVDVAVAEGAVGAMREFCALRPQVAQVGAGLEFPVRYMVHFIFDDAGGVARGYAWELCVDAQGRPVLFEAWQAARHDLAA